MFGIAAFLASMAAGIPASLPAEASAPPGRAALAAATARQASPISEDQLLLLSVQLETLTLTDSLSAYGDSADPYLPLGELARLLDLEIDVSPAAGRATGRVGQGSRSLTLDLATATFRLDGAAVAIAASEVTSTQSEIFLTASALERLLPAKFEVDGESLSLKIVPVEKLPIQARMERISRLRDLGKGAEAPDEVMRVASPYELFSPPSVDLILSTGSDTRGNRFSRRLDLRSAGDILYGGFQGFLGTDDEGRPSDARLLLERRSLGGSLLGPLRATRISGGDVFTPALALGPRSVGGRGFSLSTAPLEQASVFDTIDLRGELPTGFDVELYINDVLRSGQRSPVQGRYEFLDVSLVRGVNVIRIVSYGPRGERSEQVRVVNVGGGQLPQGRTTIEFGVVEQDRPVVEFGRGLGIRDPASGQLRVVGSLAHGLSEGATLVAGAAFYPQAFGKQRQLLTAGVRTSLFGWAAHVDAAMDQKGGRAVGMGLAGQPLGMSVVAGHFEYRGGFNDENQVVGDPGRPLSRHTELTVDLSLPSIAGKVIPLSFRALRSGFAGGGSTLLASARASATIADYLLSTGLDYQRSTGAEAGRSDQLGGVFAASRLIDYKWQLRAALDYELRPRAQMRALSVTADRTLGDRLAVRLGVGHSFQRPRSTSLQGGATFRLPFGEVALIGDYSLPRKDWGVGLRLAFGLGSVGGARGYRLAPPGVASGGSATFSAFIDRNGNGRLDRDEEAVPNVSIEGAERSATTNKAGSAFVSGLGTAPSARLQIGTDRIEHFYVTTPPRTVQVSPRPGKIINIAYPLKPTGEVVTRLLFQRAGQTLGLSAVRLRLVGDGSEPRVVTTEFDGSAVFSDVPAGSYRLELDPAQAERLSMRLAQPVAVIVAADGNPVPDVNAEVVFDRPVKGEGDE
jgi:hypothetical protein